MATIQPTNYPPTTHYPFLPPIHTHNILHTHLHCRAHTHIHLHILLQIATLHEEGYNKNVGSERQRVVVHLIPDFIVLFLFFATIT